VAKAPDRSSTQLWKLAGSGQKLASAKRQMVAPGASAAYATYTLKAVNVARRHRPASADGRVSRPQVLCCEARMVAQKFQRSYPGTLSASTSAFIVPNVVSGLSANPSANAWMIDSLKSIRG
jgi:hypothetical protein